MTFSHEPVGSKGLWGFPRTLGPTPTEGWPPSHGDGTQAIPTFGWWTLDTPENVEKHVQEVDENVWKLSLQSWILIQMILISLYTYIYIFIYTSIAVVFRDLQLKGPEWQTVERKMVEKPTALEIQLSTWRWWLFIVSIPAVPPQKWDHNTRLPQLQGSSN